MGEREPSSNPALTAKTYGLRFIKACRKKGYLLKTHEKHLARCNEQRLNIAIYPAAPPFKYV
jgi:hypothetical protein